MQSELFGEIKEVYELYDAMRYRVILRAEKTANEAEASNQHFIKSLCPHLYYRKASEAKTRVYTVKR
jgi:hypothetical protein